MKAGTTAPGSARRARKRASPSDRRPARRKVATALASAADSALALVGQRRHRAGERARPADAAGRDLQFQPAERFAGGVVVHGMAELVRHDACQLIAVGGFGEQAAHDHHAAIRQGERVHHPAVGDDERGRLRQAGSVRQAGEQVQERGLPRTRLAAALAGQQRVLDASRPNLLERARHERRREGRKLIDGGDRRRQAECDDQRHGGPVPPVPTPAHPARRGALCPQLHQQPIIGQQQPLRPAHPAQHHAGAIQVRIGASHGGERPGRRRGAVRAEQLQAGGRRPRLHGLRDRAQPIEQQNRDGRWDGRRDGRRVRCRRRHRAPGTCPRQSETAPAGPAATGSCRAHRTRAGAARGSLCCGE